MSGLDISDIKESGKFCVIRRSTVRARDPPYMTPHLWLLMRNRLLRCGQHEATSALADRIQVIITKSNASSLKGVRRGSKNMWVEVRCLRTSCATSNDQRYKISLNAYPLNEHFSKISTDHPYAAPYCSTAQFGTDRRIIPMHFSSDSGQISPAQI